MYRGRGAEVLLLIFLMIVSPYSCSRSEDPVGPSTSIDISGKWRGRWNSTKIGRDGSIVLILTQNRTNFEGEMEVRRAECIEKGSITGSINGNTLSFSLFTEKREHIIFNGKVDNRAENMNGYYSVDGGIFGAQGEFCSGDMGLWKIDKEDFWDIVIPGG